MEPYPEGGRPPFTFSYDITGEGMESPFLTKHMCYESNNIPQVSLHNVLRVSAANAIEELRKDLKTRLRQTCRTFATGKKRHICKAGRIYSSFTLPYFCVRSDETQRNSEIRLQYFGIGRETIHGKTVLDLGCNIGGMLFSVQKYNPRLCLGIEYDANKVLIAKEIAAFNGLNNFRFTQADIDFMRVQSLDGPFDVVFCLAIEAHVKKPKRLFNLLSQVTADALYFEGNSTTDPEMVKKALICEGFRNVKIIGTSGDDCIPENNCRPLIIAKKLSK